MKLRWKWLLWVVIALGALVLLCVGRHYRAKAVVENYREKLRAQGGKMTVAELIPEMPADELNAGPDLLSAAARLYSMPSNYPPLMKGIAPGHALVGWAEETSPTRDSANIWPDFAQTMHERSEGLADIRAALKRPSLSFRVNYTQGYSVPIPHLPNLKKAVSWLSMETVLDLHENQPDKAWDNLCACARVVQLYKGEPLEISQLVRAAMSQIAISTSWEALQYPDWSEAQLAALQQIWGSFDLMDGLDSSMAMERAFNPDIFASCRNSFEETSSINSFSTPTNSGSTTISDLGEALANPRESLRSFMDRYPRYWAWKWWWSYEEELSMLQSSEAGLDAVRSIKSNNAFVPAMARLNETLANIRKSHPKSEQKFLLNIDPGAYITRYLNKLAAVELERRMLVTAIALQRYHLRRGAFPKELSDLVPEYLPALPVDLMNGKPLHYRLQPDGTFLLYSVGEDGQDNGGDPSPAGTLGSIPTLQRWWNARDAVWPAPATPEQIKAYEDKVMVDWENSQARRKVK